MFDAPFRGVCCDQLQASGLHHRADLEDLYDVVELGLENIEMDYRELDYLAVSVLRLLRDWWVVARLGRGEGLHHSRGSITSHG